MPVHLLRRLTRIPALLALCLLVAQPIHAEDSPTGEQKPTAPLLADVLSASGIKITGYVSSSYYHSSGYNSFHEFDVHHNTFQLDQAGLEVGYQPKTGFGGFLDLLGGEDARILNTVENATNSTFNIRQAYLQYAWPSVTLIAGKFTTLAGDEYSNPVTDMHFSRSFLFFAEPLTHTGVRSTWAVTDTVKVIAGLNNGWNTTSTSYGSKTGEIGATYTPSKAMAFYLTGYFGKDPTFDAERSFVDFVGTCALSETLSFALNVDWGKQAQSAGPDLNWDGVAAYVTYAINSLWRLSLRGEYVDDKDGFITGTAQKLKEVTLTAGFSPV
ncbi:MAG: outer membrane beta-barrel protein, partial [Sinobacteraceae bacterium]|nr:outer membrane beta-barrel protein [Nevskiaceae bacterium]